jgi:hypothetical protein
MLTHYYNIQTRGAAAMSLLCRMQDFALALPLLNPKRSLGCYSTNEAASLSPVSSLLDYNVTPLRPQSGKTSVPKIKSIVIITIITDLGLCKDIKDDKYKLEERFLKSKSNVGDNCTKHSGALY